VATLFVIDRHHPEIDPVDVVNAIHARFRQKLKERPGASTRAKIEEIAEDLFLASLANTPEEKWSDDTWQTIKERVRSSLVGNFSKRVNSKRVSEFTTGDIFMLRKWRNLHRSEPRFSELPGLQAWHPRAAMALMRREGLFVGSSEKWYEDRRLNLGLTPHRRYVVLDAGTHLRSDEQWAVKIRDDD
jgi:hypothetical protein